MARGDILCMGDKTTCGGVILEGNPNRTAHQRPVARMGDRVLCGKDGNIYKIVGGISFMKDNGLPVAGTLDSFCGCSCKSKFIVTKYPAMTYEARSGGLAGQDAAPSAQDKSAATAISAKFAAKKTVIPVFAKSGERGAGNTDAGTADEPNNNFGRLSYGIPTRVEPAQHAQAAKRKPAEDTTPALPWYKRMFGASPDTPAQAGMPLAIPAATGGGAELIAAGMNVLRGISLAEVGTVFVNPVTVGVAGTFYSSKLNAGEDDYLAGSQLVALAGKSAPTRIRFQWVDKGTGRLEPVAYHTSPESGLDKVRVRSMTRNHITGNYEFWADDADKPTIVWTPDETEFNAPSNTGNRDEPLRPTLITVLPLPGEEELGSSSTSLPMPDEKSFEDYILVNLPHGMPPIYIYLSKPPTKFLEVELYSDFKGRPREGMHADHMPSKAAVKANLKRRNPKLTPRQLDDLAEDVAAVIIPADTHRQDSETYGGRNSPEQISQDEQDLRAAADRNFDALESKLKAKGATAPELDAVRNRMHKINNDQGLYDK